MKKFISITFIIMIFPVLIGCSKVSQTKDMQIQSLETTKEESDVLNLLCSNLDYKIYEYKINDKIKTVTIKYYKLNSEGKWDNLNNLIDNNPSSGKLSISKSRVNEQM